MINTPTYKKNIQILLKENLIDEIDYFDYEGTPMDEIFDLYFEYCQTYLDLKCKDYKIEPAKLYFTNNRTINAFATKQNRYFLIGINCGMIILMYDFFSTKKEVFEKTEFYSYSTVLKNLNYKTFEFLTIILCQFIFHHEVAHLIQRNEQKSFLIHEALENNEKLEGEAFTYHVQEFDADWLASNKVAF